ncbi:MAG: DUF2851 family protein [Bacteroidia bacterium]|nr:DUF2851 family protein [Bacteroidia bacterium]
MLKLKEDLLQFIWQQRLLKPLALFTAGGNELVIVKTGDLNRNSGPDFFNARIKLKGVELIGNIEIHIKTSDWLKHGHQHDKSYDNIILHVVFDHDVELDQNRNHSVEVLEIKNLIDHKVLEKYEGLIGSGTRLPCAAMLKSVDDVKLISWMERMAVERLEHKTKRLADFFAAYNSDYISVFYSSLLRSFGFQVNAQPFEMLARQLPYQLLIRHSDSLLQLEALLLGTAGFLEDQFEERYLLQVQNEFEYLKHKYGLISLNKEIFKFSRLRPANFPDRRLSQLALLLHLRPQLLTSPYRFKDYSTLMQMMEIKSQGYWSNHYKLNGAENSSELSFGKSSAENIIINSIAPFLFFYAKKNAKPDLSSAAITLLSQCSLEQNVKTQLFSAKKEVLKNAADSQGIINLYDNYCSRKNCLNCGIASSLLKSA